MKKFVVLAIAASAACVAGPASAASTPSFVTIAAFDASAGEIPESITTDREGNLYYSLASLGKIGKRSPDGQTEIIGTLPISAFTLGVKVGRDGCVYTVSTSLSATPGAFVWRICTAGQVELFATLDQSGGPNDLAFDDAGNLYVTDPFLGRIWQVSPDGSARVWLDDPLLAGDPTNPALKFHAVGVDGIAFDRTKRNLYVDNLDFGLVLRIDFDHGTAGGIEIFASDPSLRGADGIAFDEAGNLFVAVNAQDAIAVVHPCGTVDVVARGGVLDGPSSLVFGATPFDRHVLYGSSSAFSRAFGFESGTPRPALLSATVAIPGLRLP